MIRTLLIVVGTALLVSDLTALARKRYLPKATPIHLKKMRVKRLNTR